MLVALNKLLIKIFLGTGRIELSPPKGVDCHWSEKGSYRLEQMLKTIKNLPNRSNPWMKSNYAIYVLDDYAVHLMPEVRRELFKLGYILVIIGGGITGDIQINDTHFHGPLKAKYREIEMAEMLKKLEKYPNKIPSPDRDEMMKWTVKALDQINVNAEQAFKHLFVTTALDGSEDLLVSQRIMKLVGEEMIEFRKGLKAATSLTELLKTITPPKGIKRKNCEGSELFDCDGDEIEQPDSYEVVEDFENGKYF